MVTIEISSLAIASIFEFPNPLNRSSIEDWAENNDWELIGDQIQLEGPGPPIRAQSTIVGKKERFALAYNEKTELRHYGQSAFVTVKDEEGGDSQELIEITSELRDLFEEKSVLNQVDTYEITLEGRASVGQENEISVLTDESKLSRLGDIHGNGSHTTAMRITSKEVDDQGTYFYLLLDTDTNNPAWWQVKYVRRYEFDEYSKEAMLDDLKDVIEVTETES